MRLTELDPRWLIKDGRRIGLIFVSPSRPPWRQVCTFEPTSFRDQCTAVWSACDDVKAEGQQHFGQWQSARENLGWTVVGGPESATLETITITPSIDGSAAGLWHGFITNGEVR